MKTSNVIVICASCLLAGTLFWPGLYRYDKDQMLNWAIVRTNRLTGRTSVLLGGIWRPMPAKIVPPPPAKPSGELPGSELAKLTGNAAVSGGAFSGRIYNGSNWRIERVYLVATVKERSGKVRWTREMSTRLDADPLETKFFSVSVTGDENIGSTDWNIERAFGFKSDDITPSHYVDGPDGLIGFPGSMSDEEIEKAMRELYSPKSPNTSDKR